MIPRPLSAALLLSLAACTTAPVAPVASSASTAPDADRRAILAMLGEYDVDFDFQETVVLKPDYETHPAEHTAAHEVVILVSDDAQGIVLQHLLVVGKGMVVKHWRQDWRFEAKQRLEFSEDQTWRLRDIPAAVTRGAWTQCVYEVSDAPRYCGTGRWEYRGKAATWTSDRVFRPLPRREYTTRKDYNALEVVNRHTITPEGWTHEQDNTKLIRDGSTVREEVVREFGFNDYRHTTKTDFKPAYAYWDATRSFWAGVRARWQQAVVAHGGIRLLTPVDGTPMIEPLFDQAEKIQAGTAVPAADADAVFARWVTAPAKP
ncbi:MAG: DUF6607 family protein [Solimonas sp.]